MSLSVQSNPFSDTRDDGDIETSRPAIIPQPDNLKERLRVRPSRQDTRRENTRVLDIGVDGWFLHETKVMLCYCCITYLPVEPLSYASA